LAGPILFAPFALIWFLSRGRLMGLGDGKIALGIGFLLGLSRGISALLMSFWLGAIVSLLIWAVSKVPGLFGPNREITMKTEIPFAPFLIAGTLIAFIWNVDFGTLGSLFQAIQF
jgi:leader peptidase (prepilin peptidase)/N-methyltransferase